MRINWIIGLLWLAMILAACVDEYFPNLDRYENILVVDGMITNGPGPYTIRLSYSATIDNPRYIPLNGCSVSIREFSGDLEVLQETEPGVYTTVPGGIQGQVGKKYRAEIITPNGNSYYSEYSEMKEPVAIDSLYPLTEFYPGEEYSHNIQGYRFYITTEKASHDSTYFLWDLWATYQYEADFKIRYYFAGTLETFPRPDSLQTCWRTDNIKQLFTAGTVGLDEPVIKDFPLHYVSTEGRALAIRYSLLVNQFTLNSADFRYWDDLRRQNEDQGGYYSNQPYQIRGNIKNTNDPEDPVLGNFTAAGISWKRIFISRPMHLDFFYVTCEISEVDIENFGMIYLEPPEAWPVYATTTIYGLRALPSQDCMDCRRSGGTIEKPYFWIDQ